MDVSQVKYCVILDKSMSSLKSLAVNPSQISSPLRQVKSQVILLKSETKTKVLNPLGHWQVKSMWSHKSFEESPGQVKFEVTEVKSTLRLMETIPNQVSSHLRPVQGKA